MCHLCARCWYYFIESGTICEGTNLDIHILLLTSSYYCKTPKEFVQLDTDSLTPMTRLHQLGRPQPCHHTVCGWLLLPPLNQLHTKCKRRDVSKAHVAPVAQRPWGLVHSQARSHSQNCSLRTAQVQKKSCLRRATTPPHLCRGRHVQRCKSSWVCNEEKSETT